MQRGMNIEGSCCPANGLGLHAMGRRKQLKVLRRIANLIYALKHIKLWAAVWSGNGWKGRERSQEATAEAQ